MIEKEKEVGSTVPSDEYIKNSELGKEVLKMRERIIYNLVEFFEPKKIEYAKFERLASEMIFYGENAEVRETDTEHNIYFLKNKNTEKMLREFLKGFDVKAGEETIKILGVDGDSEDKIFLYIDKEDIYDSAEKDQKEKVNGVLH